jgi:pyrroline-5-carboxylate reductase
MKKTNSKKTDRIAVIGAGKMATAIVGSLVSKGVPASSILAYDVSAAAARKFSDATGCKTAATLADALKDVSVVLLAVKPQVAPSALKDAGSALRGKLLISIVAGLKLETLASLAATGRIVRVMPNTPALVQQGMSCFAVSPKATAADREHANGILSSFGLVREVPEALLDAVTGLSGSGPAFVMEFILGLAEGGVYCGLPRDLAVESAIQTVLGTAEMCKRDPQAISALRNAVITPNGTTARGIHVLDTAGFRGIVENCVIAAAERSAELGRK